MSMFDKNHNLAGRQEQEIHELLAGHQGQIRSYILTLTADSHIANDVLQETNLVICKKSSDFQKGTNFGAWARRIAFFEVMRHRKALSRDKLVFDDSVVELLADETIWESDAYRFQKKALSLCLGKLKTADRKLILQRYYEGISVDRMAENGGLKANAISQKLFRIRKALLKCVRSSLVATQKSS